MRWSHRAAEHLDPGRCALERGAPNAFRGWKVDESTTFELTRLIESSRDGNRAAQDRLFALVYEELRGIARRSRFVGREGETFQPTALANEVYIELTRRMGLARPESAPVREVFFTTVGRAMRTILRDYWRSRNAAKRGGSAQAASLAEVDEVAAPAGEFDTTEFIALDEALNRLEEFNPRWFHVVMHRYFAGREIEETAELMNIAPTTVKSDWQLARAWLRREMAGAR